MTRRLFLHDRHEAAGAGFLQRRGWTLPAHYGGGTEGEALSWEYAAARGRCAIVDLSDRALLAVTGRARQTLLHRLLSNEVTALRPGQGRRAALLDARGHPLAWVRVLVTAEAVLLETDSERRDLLRERLSAAPAGSPVRLASRGDVVLGLLGPGAGAVLRESGGLTPPPEPEGHAPGTVAGLPVRVVRAGDLPCQGLVLHAPPETAPALWATLCTVGARPLGRRALDALRVEQGRPWFGDDVTEEDLLPETGLVREFCAAGGADAVGLERLARPEDRPGRVGRWLRGLRLTSAVEAGAVVQRDSQPVGRVTTAAVSPRLGPVALAWLHRSVAAPGTELSAGGTGAVVAELPLEPWPAP